MLIINQVGEGDTTEGAAVMKFKVIRPHQGDRDYVEGETREGTWNDLKHLVPKVLEPIDEPPVANNAAEQPQESGEGSAKQLTAPENKADAPKETKAGKGRKAD